MMKFGVMDELQYGPAYDPDFETTLSKHLMEVVEADRLGYDYFFFPEHQCTPGYAVPSASVIIGMAAKMTKKIRLGAMVYLMPLNLPGKLAAEITMLDHITGGRLEVGVGSGSSPDAFTAFGLPWEKKGEITFEGLEVMIKAWTEPKFTHKGKYYTHEDYEISIPPYQKPYPPLWYPTRAFDSIAYLAKNGMSTIQVAFGRPETVKKLFDFYRKTVAESGVKKPGHLAIGRQVCVAGSEAEAKKIAMDDYVAYWKKTIMGLYQHERMLGGQDMIDRCNELLNIEGAEKENGFLFGTPQTIADKILEMREYYQNDVWLPHFDFGPRTYKYSKESMKLFAKEVIPRIRKAEAREAPLVR